MIAIVTLTSICGVVG